MITECFFKEKERYDSLIYHPDYKDIIIGPYIDPFKPDTKMSKNVLPNREEAGHVYERVVAKHPLMKKVILTNTVDESKITDEYTTINKTVYQMNYCSGGKTTESEYAKLRGETGIPIDWRALPLTIQKRGFNDWKKLLNWPLKPAKSWPLPECELGISWEEQQLLNTTTGKTEYQENISDNGTDILDYAFYGEVKVLPHEYRKK